MGQQPQAASISSSRPAYSPGRAIIVKGWEVHEPRFVACNGERTLATVRSAVVIALRDELAQLSR